MGEITSMIVHELNQPLTAIANFGEAARRLIERRRRPGDRAADFVEKSVAQAHRASDIIRRLRAFVSRGPGRDGSRSPSTTWSATPRGWR